MLIILYIVIFLLFIGSNYIAAFMCEKIIASVKVCKSIMYALLECQRTYQLNLAGAGYS